MAMKANRLLLSVDELMARSRARAGVDIVDEEVIEPLTIMHRSLCEEADLDAEGAKAQTEKLLRLLTNRLRMRRDFASHPEIEEQPIRGPLIVMGMPRTGTTKTQKALAASGDFNWLSYWESFNWASVSGRPHESTETRIAEADVFCRWLDARSPRAKLAHSFETLEPEEDTVLSEGSFVSVSFLGYANLPGYAEWLGKQSPGIMFEFLRDAMKYLQWQGLASAGKPWLLKSPAYSGLELVILETFPDARFVVTHRSPLKTLPSLYKFKDSLLEAFTGTDSSSDHSFETDSIFDGVEHALSIRRSHPELPVLDLRYEEVTGSFRTAVEKIYEHAGLPLSDAARERVLRWDAEHAIHKYGEHRYSLEEFGLSEELIRKRMAGYFELLRRLAEESPAGPEVGSAAG